MHGLEQHLSSLSAQRSIFNERVGDLKKILSAISEKKEAENRLATVLRTNQSLKTDQEELSEFNQTLQQHLKERKKEKDQLDMNLDRVNVDIKLLEDMAGNSVEDQEKTSKNLKQKLQECSVGKSRCESQVAYSNVA